MSTRIAVVRDSVIRIVRMLTEKKVSVTQHGSTAYVTYNTDGTPKVVNIPHIPDDAADDLLVATQGFLDHEVAHVLFTDYAAVKIANEQGFASLHNIIEDSFIERKMAVAFAGSAYNLSEMGQYFLKNYTDTRLKGLKPGDPTIEGLLIVPAIRAWAGQMVYQDYMKDGDKWAKIEKIVKRLEPVIDRFAKVETSMDAANLARDAKKLLELDDEALRSAAPPPPKGAKSKGSGKSSSSGKASKRPKRETTEDEEMGAGGSASADEDDESTSSVREEMSASEEERDDDADDSADDGDDPDDSADSEEVDDVDTEEDEDEEDDDDEEPETAGSSGYSGGESGGGGPVKGSGDLYKAIESEIGKDFDAELSKMITKSAVKGLEKTRYKVWTTDFDKIEPLSPGGRFDDKDLAKMQDAVDHMVGPLQKDFERAIAAKSATTWSAGHRSGKLHAAALSRLKTGDDRIFRRKHINNSKDVAVSLLVDCSGSMGSCGKIEAAAYSAYALASVLDRIGISCEVLGFTTQGYFPPAMGAEAATHGIKYSRKQPLYIPILKSFSERLNTDTKRRFACLPEASFLNENVDGESVLIAARRLAARREVRKVLFVFSDGQPACPGEWKELCDHLKKSVREVEQQGIDVLGIGIQDDSAAQYYSKHVLLTSLSDLPTTVMAQIKKILMQ